MRSSSKVHQALMLLCLVVLTCLVYSNTLQAPFYFDDSPNILKNPHIRLTKLTLKDIARAGLESRAHNRPIANISFAINYYFHQYDVTGYHAVNIIIHITAGILLYLFLKTTLTLAPVRSKYASHSSLAFFAAAIWLVHPIQTQSVTYIVQRMNSMAALFYVLSLFLYARGRIVQKQNQGCQLPEECSNLNAQSSKGGSWPVIRNSHHTSRYCHICFIGCALSWILALGCKETSATLPFFVLLYEWYFLQDLSKAWLKSHLKYLLGIFLVLVLVGIMYLGWNPLQKIISIPDYANNQFTLAERVLTQSRVVVYYMSLLLYPSPSRLNLDYDFSLSHSLIDPITTLLCFGAIFGLIGLAICAAKKERLISFCILWFFGNLAIESSIIPAAIIFEHRTYLPSMLFVLIPAIMVCRHVRMRSLLLTILAVIVLVFSIWTIDRNSLWSDPVRFFMDAVQKSPNKARVWNNLGFAYRSDNLIDKAISSYKKAINLNPDYVSAYVNLGAAYSHNHMFDEAIDCFEKAIALKPDDETAHFNMAVVFYLQGDRASVNKSLDKAKELGYAIPDSFMKLLENG